MYCSWTTLRMTTSRTHISTYNREELLSFSFNSPCSRSCDPLHPPRLVSGSQLVGRILDVQNMFGFDRHGLLRSTSFWIWLLRRQKVSSIAFNRISRFCINPRRTCFHSWLRKPPPLKLRTYPFANDLSNQKALWPQCKSIVVSTSRLSYTGVSSHGDHVLIRNQARSQPG